MSTRGCLELTAWRSNIIPDPTTPSPTDKFNDLGFDTQFQYLSGVNFVTARASYTYEWQKLDGSVTLGNATNVKNFVSELNLSATYSFNSALHCYRRLF